MVVSNKKMFAIFRSMTIFFKKGTKISRLVVCLRKLLYRILLALLGFTGTNRELQSKTGV